MKIQIDLKHLINLTIAFILFTVIGTVSHEYGHIIVAKSLGYKTTLHYGSMNYDMNELYDILNEINEEYGSELKNGIDFERKAEYKSTLAKLKYHRLLVDIGGPLQTILTGIFGLLILYFRKNKRKVYGFNKYDWLAVFLSLFWLREIFNLTLSVFYKLLKPKGSYFGGDEYNISIALNIWEGTIPIILGIIGLIISLFVVFKIIPVNLRLTFILSGFLGGIIGFISWMYIVGPIVLP